MAISVLDLFKVGIGPSSSHTVGPMRAALLFVSGLRDEGLLGQVAGVKAELFGSLGATGKGHGSDKAVLLGLEGEAPERVDPEQIDARLARIRGEHRIRLAGVQPVRFVEREHLVLHRRQSLPYHPNGMRLAAFDAAGALLCEKLYYSVGGGFVVDERAAGADRIVADTRPLAHPFRSGAELLANCRRTGLAISQLMLENERAWRSDADTRAGLLDIWGVMQACVRRGCEQEGVMPGGLHVRRRAAALYRQLSSTPEAALRDPLTVLDWVNLYALAVNEENASGGRVVTAPTTARRHRAGGAALLHPLLCRGERGGRGAFPAHSRRDRHSYKENASIRAEVGCQGEVCRLLDGRGRSSRRGRDERAGRERRRDRHGAQPRADLRPGRRAGAGAVHRAQRDGRDQGHQRCAHGLAR
jgi:L-serine dehydratase